MLTFTVEQEVLHVVAEWNIHIAALELTGQATAVEWSDCVSTAGWHRVNNVHLKQHLKKNHQDDFN